LAAVPVIFRVGFGADAETGLSGSTVNFPEKWPFSGRALFLPGQRRRRQPLALGISDFR